MASKIKKIWFLVNKGRDKRKSLRLRGHHLIKYDLGKESDKKVTFAQNVSEGGALVYFSEEVKKGDVIKFEVLFPFYSSPVKIVGEIVWVKCIEKFNKYKTGIKFLEIDQKVKGKISEIAEDFQNKKKKKAG